MMSLRRRKTRKKIAKKIAKKTTKIAAKETHASSYTAETRTKPTQPVAPWYKRRCSIIPTSTSPSHVDHRRAHQT